MSTTLLTPNCGASTWEPIDDHPLDLAPYEFRLADAEQLSEDVLSALDATTDVDYPLPHDFRLSVIVPVYNEEGTIATVIQRLMQLPFRTEIAIVDDGSTDGTRDVLARLAHFCDLKIFYHPQNQGKGAAIRTAIPEVTGDVVVIQDADLEYDPQDLVQVIRPIVTGEADVAYGSRFMNQDTAAKQTSWVRQLGNQTLTCISNCLTGLHLTDMQTALKAFPRNVIQQVELQENRFGIEPEITAKLAKRNYRFVERPVTYNAQDWSASNKIGWKDGSSALWCILRYRLAD
ncbi:glycosyltransferase family 2 protein [Bremerella alba]|uniref:Undecaprenyl-phosphate 4-deoxy-4-formamido-L-arabinose transferase n=1 Tax=Bremerella alba TaxID=980252 RepID=A0A7V8V9W7_9BACT|nr:glycosyltransferase family 2 protein [Bremerella alba]MBA2117628.1 Undecaprenyl-phosphate 4-deoxy-4-formamido-L-arabinose transferase [Bremerella alba]